MRCFGASVSRILTEVNLLAVDTTKTEILHYSIDVRLSRFTVQAFAGGFLSAFAHNPTFAIRDFSGEAQLDPEHLASAVLRIEIRADSLQLLNAVSDKDHREIERVMRDEALETAAYPAIIFQSTRVSATPVADGQYSLALEGDLSLHGVTQRLTIPARVAFTGDTLRAFGVFSLKQTDYRIKLVAVAGGAIKVKDVLHFPSTLSPASQE